MAKNQLAKPQEFRTWDDFASEAQHEPYLLKVSDEETIVIEVPSGAQIIHAGRAIRSGDEQMLLYALTGEAWQRIEELLATAGFKAMVNLATELLIYFEISEPVDLVGPGGGKRTVRDPREVQRLVRSGWSAVGEAGSRP